MALEILTEQIYEGPEADAVLVKLAPPWRCLSCGEIVEAQFQACWKCGTARS